MQELFDDRAVSDILGPQTCVSTTLSFLSALLEYSPSSPCFDLSIRMEDIQPTILATSPPSNTFTLHMHLIDELAIKTIVLQQNKGRREEQRRQ